MARSSASPRQTPSRPPSRQSTRIITPARPSTLLVRLSQDSRKLLTHHTHNNSETESSSQMTQPPNHKKKRTKSNNQTSSSKQKYKRKKKNTAANAVNESDEVEGVLDITQDLDAANFKVRQPSDKKISPFDDVQNYFFPPYHAQETETGEKLMFKCKWCRHDYKKGVKTDSNLTKHRDGASDRNTCSGRSKAIASGAKLPPTAKEMILNKERRELGTMRAYLKHAAFDTWVFNQLLVMWLIRFSLAWNRIEDFLLHVAIDYARHGVHINTRVWAATEAHRLYLNLQGKLFSSLRNLGSKFTLIHDVWTTKGNHHAFMGISVAYVSDDWTFHISHLGLKYIASNHKGKLLAIPFANVLSKSGLANKITQTTDSGSNNFTMASEVDRLITKKTGIDPNLSENHIRCYCHKIALILNAGLQSLKLSTEEFIPSKEEILGFAPGLSPIAEESEEIEPTDHFVQEDVVLDEEHNQQATNNDEDNNEDDSPGQNTVGSISEKVDFIIQRITSSAAKQSEYDTWCRILVHNGPSLIAGYGIRWNIKFRSREAGFQARRVISKLIENECDRQEREGGKNYYSNMDITRSEWDMVNKLNEILKEFYFLTKSMEGDHSSGALLVSKYLDIKDVIKRKSHNTSEPEFKKMLQTMKKKTDKYLEEALGCDAILVATVLNPSFRLSIFKMWFPTHYDYTLDLITNLFTTRKAEFATTASSKEPTPPVKKRQGPEVVDYFPDNTVEAATPDELSVYLGGKYKLPTDEADQLLGWWKDHCQEFPILALLARDYLACSGTSASVERCFSAAANTCGHDRGSLAAKTIERCVSSHQWLIQGVEPDGPFEIAQGVITRAAEEKALKKADETLVATTST
ncbi:hypothetical protein MJO28_013048 [Puccinia striiformis f. sp. tritici]|uniref:Uncharacterized protein n=1 Tax=Puccinia striiformis f. sp. tritici TaxID=168172 RepID=A0ACC0DZ50_9BASI|nr:hypothetical protein MJO28_013048 [Puccinia striiformis f. sp. tritici]